MDLTDYLDGYDWNSPEKCLADLEKIKESFPVLHEPIVSPDGEKIAIPVQNEEEWTVTVNGEAWPDMYERAWYPQFHANGKLLALVMVDGAWTVCVDGKAWDETFDFVWSPKFSPDGSKIAAQIKREDQYYTIAVDGKAWESNFISTRDFALDNAGNVAVTIQAKELGESDISGFREGTWSLAFNDKQWEQIFVNVYNPVISADGKHVAAEVRSEPFQYTVAQDGQAWNQKFGSVWEVVYDANGSILAPVKHEGSWTVAKDGDILWKRKYTMVWRLAHSPDQKKLAAVVSPEFGRWTIAVDDVPWSITVSDLVMTPVFSADGSSVGATVKDAGQWMVAINGKLWKQQFDMVWDPVFSRDGKVAAAKVEKNGKYTLAVNGKVWSKTFEKLWPPVVSSDGSKIILKTLEGGKYYRRVINTSEIG